MDITQNGLSYRGPKNKKQIGKISKGDKIYIEDYAVTYLNQVARAPETKQGYAGLFGTCKDIEGVKEYYIYAAIYQECGESMDRGLPRDLVQKIMRQRGEFFSEFYFLGWAMICGEKKGAVWESCYRSRLESLMGTPELLMTIKVGSSEEKFYLYPTEMPKQVDGYCIFYEQNDAMQNFLIGWHGKNRKDKCDGEGDLVAQSCRNYYKEKKAIRMRNKVAGALYTVVVLLLIFCAGVGIQSLNDYNKIEEVGQAMENEVQTTGTIVPEELVPIEYTTIKDDTSDSSQEEVKTESGEEVQQAVINNETLAISDEERPVDKAEEIFEEASEDISEDVLDKMSTELSENVSPETSVDTVEEDTVEEDTVEEDTVIQPVILPEPYVTYEVQKGDTLYGICVRFYGNLSRAGEVCDLNEIKDMDNILYGQKILLPQ